MILKNLLFCKVCRCLSNSDGFHNNQFSACSAEFFKFVHRYYQELSFIISTLFCSDQSVPFGNVMFDRRVARGSTCASVPTLVSILLIFLNKHFFHEIRIYLDRWGTIDSSEASGSETKTFGEKTCSSASLQNARRQDRFTSSSSRKKT